MRRHHWLMALALGALVGCGTETTEAPPPPGGPGAGPPPAIDPGTEPAVPDLDAPAPEPTPGLDLPADEPGAAAAVELSDEEIAEIRKLPEEDQALALAQKVCPISGEHLGSMDVPVKVEHEGRIVFLCCEFCKPGFEADPEAALAELPPQE